MSATLHPGTLIVASATPDPPFEFSENGIATGFDIQLMQAISGQMGLTLQRVRFSGANFNDIFDYLENGTCDAVISGTTITPERSAIVLFSCAGPAGRSRRATIPGVQSGSCDQSPADAERFFGCRVARLDCRHPVREHLGRGRKALAGGERHRRHSLLSL